MDSDHKSNIVAEEKQESFINYQEMVFDYLKQLQNENSQFDLNCEPGKQLEIVPDCGSIVQ